MSETRRFKIWTRNELIEVLTYINDNSTSSDSLINLCKKASENLRLNRTQMSVYVKISKLTHSMKLWLKDNVRNGETIIWKDDKIYKLLESICNRKGTSTKVTSGVPELQLVVYQKHQVDKCDDAIDESEGYSTDSTDSTVVGDYVDYVGLYENNETQLQVYNFPLTLNDRIRAIEDEAKKVAFEPIGNVQNMNYYEINRVFKQTQKYKEEVSYLFAEVAKKINNMNS